MRTLLKLIWTPLRWALRLILALFILFEEWGWAWFGRIMSAIGRLPVLRHIERWIAGLPPYGALVMLVVPALLLLPVKILALWLIGKKHHAVMGISVILLAKIFGTAVVARIFQLIHPALMQLPWFAPQYERWLRWKTALLAWVRDSFVWRQARVIKRRIRRLWQRVKSA
ncbi:MAG: hypothetical protein JO369_01680 [Paucibacter sp.]|nr:hypothetical protein [Roseateles sp.]